MTKYLRFVLIGLVLGLNAEVQLKLIAGIKPSGFVVALFAYPVILSLSYFFSKAVDRLVSSAWKGDVCHYLVVGLFGLSVEWILLGNGPQSNAFQPGMFAMWTTFCFGPRILTLNSSIVIKAARKFWGVFVVSAALLAVTVLLMADAKVRIVMSVLGLSGIYILLSVWLLTIAWRARRAENNDMRR